VSRGGRHRQGAPAKLARNGAKQRVFFRRWWWAFLAVPLLAILGMFATLWYVYVNTEIPEAPADAHAGAVESLPAGSALLVVKRGPNAGSRFLLDQDVTTAGRHPDSDIFLDDVTVSRRHVEFHREGGGFSVHDVGSLNGTYVNREPVDVATLAGGDEVQIGKFRLVYLTGPRTG